MGPLFHHQEDRSANRSVRNAPNGPFALGFRVATPEPGTGLLVIAGMLGLAGRRRTRSIS
jgi:PEP-CTERM motif-containing protein